MTAPIIPDDQWPDEFNGDNAKLVSCINALLSMDAAGALAPHGIGGLACGLLSAAAHRLAPAPAIDLEQFRVAVEAYKFEGECKRLEFCFGPEPDKQAAIAQIGDGDRLLSLIDGQANVRSSSEQCAELATDLVTDDAVRRLVRAMENTPGDDLTEPNTRLCRRLLVAALQPTKGEGE